MSYEQHARLHICPIIGGVRIDSITTAHVDQLHAHLARTVGGTTAFKVHMTLNDALNDARRRGHRVTDAVSAVDKPRKSEVHIETLNSGEKDTLLAAAVGNPFEAAYVLSVTLGLRAGECRGLCWADVDLDAGRIKITGNATRGLDGLQVVTAPKTKAGNRTLILPQLCVEALRRTPHNGELIWPGPGGRPWSASSFNTAWKSFCKRNGIRTVTYQALRHTAATLALQAGQPPHVVAFMLGHANVATTLSLYAHVTPVAMGALADAIDAGYGPRLRVIEGSRNGHELASPKESAAIPTEKDCRGRESNSPKLGQNDRKKRRPNSRERPESAT